ncbi:MAG TPA: tryptophan--tRNA ligase [Methanocorpusculum sp.]|nr:tryptophan--tRNA ligase [Methanocorpusculum sp.]HJJ59030.1 tryptophan--tRNA ligase [Methanocorpusculum sp.]HJJ59807.1 tryptophan--tRNA ligase [Methanocorpusculum sp.]
MAEDINPWSSTPKVSIEKLIENFGIDRFEPQKERLDGSSDIPLFMRRDIVQGHRGYDAVADAILQKKPFHVLTGFMPSGHPHLGHLMVMKEVIWHIQHGGRGFISIADREAHAVRGLSWDACDTYAREYISCLYALGFEGEIYAQRKNNELKDLAFEAARKINFSNLSAIYGFGPETELAHAVSVSMQVADILYPQLKAGAAPTIVPVGIDQDPHIRLTRDVTNALRLFLVEDRGTHISIRAKNAPAEAIDAVAKAFPGSKKYEGHIDLPAGHTAAETDAVVRGIEQQFGGFGFMLPSSTYHSFLMGFQGGKMSSSVPDSLIWFDDEDRDVKKKIMGAVTGGRQTLEEQKKLGGEPDKCAIYQLNKFHMQDDDKELAKMCEACKAGELMCGTCKKETLERVRAFLAEFKEKRDEVAHKVAEWK